MATDVSFQLPDPSLESYLWEYENEHNPGSHPPLTQGLPGMESRIASDGVPQSVTVNGYGYWRVGAPGMPFSMDGVPRPPQLTPLERWRNFWLPMVDELRDELVGFDPRSVAAGSWRRTITAAGERFGRVFGGVHMTAVITVNMAAGRFVSEYAGLFGAEREADGRALLQGFSNRTSMRAGDLWQLSRMVAANPALREELVAWKPGIPLPAAGGFAAALDAFTVRWGETVDLHLQDMPTWAENPAPVVAMILSYAAQPDSRSPIVAEEAAAARRRVLEGELRARAAEDDAFKPLLEQLPVAQQMIVVSEDHNVLCDQRLIAASRARWMAVGRYLRERSLIEAPDDAFYHTPDELIDALENGAMLPSETIRERRRLQAAYRAAVPPARLGAGAEVAARVRVAVVKGLASSPGRYEGVARVARTLEAASNIEPGEVLVCGMTSPSWTPLFGVAGAIVTNAGGELSHAAIVAREFGIPAVTGTKTGTQDIPNGANVVVDGDAGTVEIIG